MNIQQYISSLSTTNLIQIGIGVVIIFLCLILGMRIARKIRYLTIVGIFLIANGAFDINIVQSSFRQAGEIYNYVVSSFQSIF